MNRQKGRSKKRQHRSVSNCLVHVKASFNNTIISVTDSGGNLLTIASAGGCGFRGTKKGTAYAASIATDRAIQLAKNNHNLQSIKVYLRGVGQGRDAAIRSLISSGLQIESLADRTPIAHGGVRPRGVRHV